VVPSRVYRLLVDDWTTFGGYTVVTQDPTGRWATLCVDDDIEGNTTNEGNGQERNLYFVSNSTILMNHVIPLHSSSTIYRFVITMQVHFT
jgi:hypothetical protein